MIEKNQAIVSYIVDEEVKGELTVTLVGDFTQDALRDMIAKRARLLGVRGILRIDTLKFADESLYCRLNDEVLNELFSTVWKITSDRFDTHLPKPGESFQDKLSALIAERKEEA